MKKYIYILLIVWTSAAFAQDKKLGLGFMLGNPTGINGKYWLDSEKAVDGGVGASLGRHSEFSIHSDYLLHNFNALYLNDIYALDLYYGLGGRLEFSDSIELGIRVPVGLVYQVKEKSAEVFSEVAPILDFIGREGLELHLAVGGRYYF
ncbi:MAG: hypothetical protein AB7I27_17190 [Bacteriovoracaceae bacterium]